MYDDGHFCLLIFSNQKWKESFKESLQEKVKSDFLLLLEPKTPEEAHILGWNEVPISPLFNPKTSPAETKNCIICPLVYEILKEIRGNNEGLILFSHNVPYMDEIKTFFKKLFAEPRIKKLYYLELDSDWTFFKRKIARDKIREKIIKRFNYKEFYDWLEKKIPEYGIFNEILKA